MWWYNILGDDKGSISYLLRLGTINAGYILLTDKLVALKWENDEPILTVKRNVLSKFIEYFGLSIEAETSRVDKKNIYEAQSQQNLFCWLVQT